LPVIDKDLSIDNLSEGGSMPGTLTKADLISANQTEDYYTCNRFSGTVKPLFEITKRTLEPDKGALMTGFGNFRVGIKSERRGRNPATNDDMILQT
jgi:integration host factor subunit alpha